MPIRMVLATAAACAALLLVAACAPSRSGRFVVLRNSEDPTVSMKAWFAVGSQDDPPGKEGLAALTADCLAEGGTAGVPYAEILRRLYPMAAGYSATVDKEMTVFHGRVHRDHLAEYADLYTRAVTEPAFDPSDFERLKSAALNTLEKTLRYGNDEAFGREAVYSLVYAGTPYGRPTRGLIESVRSVTLDDVKAFYREHYTRSRLVIGLGGPVDGRLEARLDSAFSALPEGGPAAPPEILPRSAEGRRVLLVEKDTRSASIHFAFPIGVRRGDPDFAALWLARSWFGEHRNSSSHLYQVIREKRGLNYGDYAYIEYFPDAWAARFPAANRGRRSQCFEVWLRPVPAGAAHFSLRAAVRELEALVEKGLTREQFVLTRSFLLKYRLHYAPSTSEKLGYRLDDRFYGTRDHLGSLAGALERLTLADVNAAIKKHLQYRNLDIVVIAPDAEALKESLASDAPSPLIYDAPKPAEVLEEDKVIESYRLGIREGDVTVRTAEDMFVR